MADTLTQAERSEQMSRVRSTGNRATELRLITLFRAHRISGWRRGVAIHGKPDFVFRAAKVIVFVDGCFWHGCPRHLRIPKTRAAFWKSKFDRNIRRDRAVARHLRSKGWKVLRVWECSLTTTRARRTMMRIERAIRR